MNSYSPHGALKLNTEWLCHSWQYWKMPKYTVKTTDAWWASLWSGKTWVIQQCCLLPKGSDQFRKNNLSKFARVTNSQKMASVDNFFKWLMKFCSPQNCEREFHSCESQHLRAEEVHLHGGKSPLPHLHVGRMSENFAFCFPGCRYQATADRWDNFSDQSFSCNVKGRC